MALGQTGVQIDNAESTSKADDSQVPEANPARPSVTNPAHIPPVGYLQFEQGFVQANASPDLDRQFSLNQVMKLAVHPRLMLQFVSQPVAFSGMSGARSRDTGDLQIGAQTVLLKEAGHRPAVALGYLRRVRGGTAPDLDIGSFSQSGLLLVSGDAGEFHYDANLVVSEQEASGIRRAQYGHTVSVTHDIFSPKLELSGELWHFTQPLLATASAGRHRAVGMLWALGYSVRPNLVLDAGLDHGLTATSTQWQGFAGFTYVLPQRLWPRSEPAVTRHGHRHRR